MKIGRREFFVEGRLDVEKPTKGSGLFFSSTTDNLSQKVTSVKIGKTVESPGLAELEILTGAYECKFNTNSYIFATSHYSS